MLVTIDAEPVPFSTVWVGDGSTEQKQMLFVDVARAWQSMGLKGQWSSEIDVTLRLD